MTNGGPDDQTRAMSLDIYESAFQLPAHGWSAAVSVVLFVVVLMISTVQARILRANWEYYGRRLSSVPESKATADTREPRPSARHGEQFARPRGLLHLALRSSG